MKSKTITSALVFLLALALFIVPAMAIPDDAEYGVYRNGQWIFPPGTGEYRFNFGMSTDVPVVYGDLAAVYRGGTWIIKDGPERFQFGLPTDKPFYYDGKPAVFRDGMWIIKDGPARFIFGTTGDKPVAYGDYGAVFRNGEWIVRGADNSVIERFPFGLPTDIPVVWHDGRAAVYRDGTYIIRNPGEVSTRISYGMPGDRPVTVISTEPTPLEVVSVEAITDITVSYGTAFADLGLPETVEATLSDNSTMDLEIDWSAAEADYDGETAGTYALEGDLVLPTGVTNPAGVKAAVDVIVEAPEFAVVGATAYNSVTVLVEFNRELDETTATDATNYAIAAATTTLGVTSAALEDDNKTVKLTTDAQSALLTYTVTVENVEDTQGVVIGDLNTATFAGNQAPYVLKYKDNAANEITDHVTVTDSVKLEVVFNEGLKTSTVNTQSVRLFDITAGAYLPGTVTPQKTTVTEDTIRFVPTTTGNRLTANHVYRLELSETIRSAQDYALGNLVTKEFIVGTAPVLDAGTREPTPGNTTAAVDGEISARFNVQLDQSTLTTDTVIVEELDDQGEVVDQIAGTVLYSTTFRKVTFEQASLLKGETKYRVTFVHGDIKSTAGIYLRENANNIWEFTTAASDAPVVEKVEIAGTEVEDGDVGIPIDDVAQNKFINTTFDRAIKADSVPGNVLLTNLATSESVDLTIGADDKIVYAKLGASLAAGTEYELFMAGITDNTVNENPIDDFTFTFTVATGAPSVEKVFTGNDTASEAGSTGYKLITDNSFDVPYNESRNVYFQFDKNIGISNATQNTLNTSVKLYSIGTSGTTRVDLDSPAKSGRDVGDNKFFNLSMAESKLEANKKYKVVFENTFVSDEGNPLDEKFEITFTTVQYPGFTNATYIKATLANGTVQTLEANTPATEKIALDKPVTVEFVNKTIGQSSISQDTIRLVKIDGSVPVPATYTLSSDKKTVTITPTANLAESTNYKVVVTTGLKDVNGNSITAYDSATEASEYFTTKTVVSYTSNIADLETDVALNKKLALTFNRPMNQTRLNDTSIVSFKRATSEWAPTGDELAGLQGTNFTYNINTKTLTFTHALESEQRYVLRLNESQVRDTSGNALGTKDEWTTAIRFRAIKDTVAPNFVSAQYKDGDDWVDIDGATGISKDIAEIRVKYDKQLTDAINTTSGTDYSAYITITNNTDQVPVAIPAGALANFINRTGDGKQVSINFSASAGDGASVLVNHTQFTVNLVGLEDAVGNEAEAVEFTFITGPAPVVNRTSGITLGQTGVAVDTEQNIGYENDAVDKSLFATTTAANLKVFDATNTLVDSSAWEIETSPAATAINVTIPKDTLAYSTKYFVMITGVEDTVGNLMSNEDTIAGTAGYVINFTTEADPNVLALNDTAFGTSAFAGNSTDDFAVYDTIATDGTGTVDKTNTTYLQLAFDKNLDATTVTPTNVKLYDDSDGKWVAFTAGLITVQGSDTIQLQIPGGNLSAGPIYTLTVQNVLGTSGETLAAPISIQFYVQA